MIAFDVAAALFLLSAAPLLRSGDRDAMRWRAKTNDANRTVLLGLTFLTMLAILTSVAKELGGHPDRGVVALVIATLVLAWLFTNSVYALHYAHIFYGDADGSGKDDGGLDFPKTPGGRMRRVSVGQCLAAFVFNLGVLAFTINVLGGGGGS